MKKILLGIVLSIGLMVGSNVYAAVVNSDLNNEETVEEEWWEINRSGYSITFPDYFTLQETINSSNSTSTILIDQSTNSNLNVMVQQYMNPKDYEKATKEEYKRLYSADVTVEDVTINGLKGKNFLTNVKQGIYNLKIYQTALFKGTGKVYLLSFTCLAENYDKYINDVKEVFNSFKVRAYKKPAETEQWAPIEYGNVEITIPDNLQMEGEDENSFVFFQEDFTSDDDVFVENLRLRKFKAEEKDLKTFQSEIEKKLNVIDKRKITIGGKQINISTTSTENNGIKVKSEFCIFYHANDIYQITINLEDEKSKLYKSDVDKIFKSIKLKEIVYKSPQADTKWTQHELNGMSFSCPDYYEEDDSDNTQKAFGAYLSDPNDYYREAIIISHKEASEDLLKIKHLFNSQKDAVEKYKTYENFAVNNFLEADGFLDDEKSRETVTINGNKWIAVKGDFQDQIDEKIKFDQTLYFHIRENSLALIYVILEEKEGIKAYQKDVEKVLNSIKFK